MTMPQPAEPGPGTGGVTRPPRQARPGRAGRRWWALAAVSALLGAALGTGIARAAGPAAGQNTSSAPPLPGGYFAREHGPAAPSWDLPDLSLPSKVVSLGQFRGRPLVVNFWASWCLPCRKEMPALERAARLLAGRVSFAGLDTQDERSAGLAFARRMKVTYPLATDNAQVYASYGVAGLPTTLFISADGTIVGKQVGGMTTAGLAAIVHQVFGVTLSQR